MDFLTYYRDEEQHPRLVEARAWYKDNVLSQILPAWHGEMTLAGGALRSFFTGTKVRDYDLYVSNDMLKVMKSNPRSIFQDNLQYRWKQIAESKYSYVWRLIHYDPVKRDFCDVTFNIIKGGCIDPEQILDGFDLTVCMCAITEDRMVYHPDYFLDLTAKTLRVHSLEDPIGILWRIQKYNGLDYKISKQDLWRVVTALHELDKLPTLYTPEETSMEEETTMTLEQIFRSS